jgi:hypothetical protein
MTVYTLRKTQSLELDRLIEKNVPVIIIKNFLQKKTCKKIIDYCINVSKNNPHRKISKEGDFYSVDVYPQNVITQRLFRKYMLGNNFLNKFKMINQVIDFQYKKILKPKKKLDQKYRWCTTQEEEDILMNISTKDTQVIMV